MVRIEIVTTEAAINAKTTPETVSLLRPQILTAKMAGLIERAA